MNNQDRIGQLESSIPWKCSGWQMEQELLDALRQLETHKRVGLRTTTDLYFEAHITIDPLLGEDPERVAFLGGLAAAQDFRLATFLLKKGDRRMPDDFISARDVDYAILVDRTTRMCKALDQNGFRVRRYKIENTLLDVKT